MQGRGMVLEFELKTLFTQGEKSLLSDFVLFGRTGPNKNKWCWVLVFLAAELFNSVLLERLPPIHGQSQSQSNPSHSSKGGGKWRIQKIHKSLEKGILISIPTLRQIKY
jgi:hypothetical protein